MSASDRVYGTLCNAQEYQQSLLTNPTISCLTHGQSIGLAVSIVLFVTRVNGSDSHYIQLTAEASFLSLAAVIIIFVLIGVCPTVSAIPVEFDENRAEKCATL